MSKRPEDQESMTINEERICRTLTSFRGEGFLLETAKLGCLDEEAEG